MSKVGFLHTAQTQVKTFESLVAAIQGDIEVEHVVAPELLTIAIQDGFTRELSRSVDDALASLTAKGCQAISCTCSTLGALVENQRVQDIKVQRIDRAAADLAMKFDRLLVIAALETAAVAADQLLADSAKTAGSDTRWLIALVPGAWALFEAGELDLYHQAIADFVNESAAAYDAVMLSQASMQPAVSQCRHPNVLTTPQTGVEKLLKSVS